MSLDDRNRRRRTLVNACAGVAQATVSGLVLFLLYRFLLRHIGPELLGLWSIVNALLGLSRLADIGICGAAIKLTAEALAKQNRSYAGHLLSAALQGTFLLLTPVLLFAAYAVVSWGPQRVLAHHQQLLDIIPGVLAAIWLGFLGNPLRAGLDACQRVDLRQLLVVVQQVLFLVFSWIWVPERGLLGLVEAQAMAAAVSLLTAAILLRQVLRKREVALPFASWSCAGALLNYGGKLQISSVAMLFFDPVTNYLLAHYAGLTATAWFEMASRLVFQVRALLISALETLVPYVASQDQREQTTRTSYLEVSQLNLLLTAVVFGITLSCLPAVSWLWIGHIQSTFVGFGMLLVVGWWANTVAAPAYFFFQGMGMQRWNMISGWAMALGNVVCSWLLGRFLGAPGVVAGWTMALLMASVINIAGLHVHLRIRVGEVITFKTIVLSAALLTLGLCALFAPTWHALSRSILATIVAMGISLSHPHVRQLLPRIMRPLLSR